MTFEETKKVICELKINLKLAEALLKELCPHKNIIYDGFNRNDILEYHFICKDCGMVFVTEDPNFNGE